MSRLGGLRPHFVFRFLLGRMQRRAEEVLRKGVESGVVVPGKTRGVPGIMMLRVVVEASTSQLMEEVQKKQFECSRIIHKSLAGSGHLDLNDEDLIGLSQDMKSIYTSSFGSLAVWQKAKYRVPVGRESLDRLGSFCQSPETRRRIFEAYYGGFTSEADKAALELLRARQQLAQRLGFRTWAEKELHPLASAASTEAGAQELIDKCYKDAVVALTPVFRKMEELSGGGRRASSSSSRPAALSIPQVDEAFFRALVTKEVDTWKLAEFLPANGAVPKLLDLVGRAYGVTFREVDPPSWLSRLPSGWHKSVHIFEIVDGSPGLGTAAKSRLGFVYLDLYQRRSLLGRPSVELAGAQLLCDGHAYLSMNLIEPPYGQGKLFNPEEVQALAHELGHAVHMLCHWGIPQEFHDLPLDLVELPSVLLETIAMHPTAMSQYTGHWKSKGPPDVSLLRSCERNGFYFVRYLQNVQVALGLHGEAFDPQSATPAELRATAVSLWQRVSPVTAHPSYTPFGETAGIYTYQGANQIAYLLCHLRTTAILSSQQGPSAQSGAGKSRRDTAQRWLTPDFATRIRSQLLERSYPGQRLSALECAAYKGLPEAQGKELAAALQLPHPLPPPPMNTASLFTRSAP